MTSPHGSQYTMPSPLGSTYTMPSPMGSHSMASPHGSHVTMASPQGRGGESDDTGGPLDATHATTAVGGNSCCYHNNTTPSRQKYTKLTKFKIKMFLLGIYSIGIIAGSGFYPKLKF